MKTAKACSIVSIVLVITAVLCTEAASQKVLRRKRGQRPKRVLKSSPLATFKGIERAWVSGDAAALSRFTGEGKAFISVKGIGQRGGYFSRPQVHYLFKRMFKKFSHSKFNFVKYHNLDKPEGRVYGIAHRSYRSRRNGKYYHDKVYVTLRKEGETWVMNEIKTTR